jgi:hypothetical protein
MANKKPIVNSGAPTTITPQVTPPNAAPNAGSGLNTGDNGFPLTVPGNGAPQKFTYDTGSGGSGGSQGNYKQGVDVSAAFTDQNGNPLDIKPATLTTLAQYLSRLTMGQEGAGPGQAPPLPNRYPVGDGTTDKVTSLVDSKGNPSPLESPPQNPATFAGNAEANFDYPSAQYPTIQSLIKKGIAASSGVDGNDLLAGVTGTSTSVSSNPSNLTGDAPATKAPLPGHADTSAKIINPYTSAVLANNRFTSAAAAFAQVTDVSDPGTNYDPALSVQSKLGEWDPNAQTYTVGRLATIGPLLGLRATTTLGATSAGADPNSAGLEAAALLPGFAQLGAATIDQHVLQAKDILTSLTSDDVTGSATTLSIGTQSWGQLNDVNDPFDGTDALGMLTLMLALVAAVQVIIGLLAILLGMVTPQTKTAMKDSQGRYTLGQYFPTSKPPNASTSGGPLGAISALASLNFGALLGINPTVYPLQTAMNSGLAAFYGLPQPSGGGFSIGFSLGPSSSTDSPGYLVTVSRTIIRGFVIIGQSLSKIGGNPMNVINAILSMIDTIRSSKVVAAINIWAMLGDQILTLNKSYVDNTGPTPRTSQMDAITNDNASGVNKNRLQGSLKLAWASNRAPTEYLLPSTILGLAGAVRMGQFNPYATLSDGDLTKTQKYVTTPDMGGRLPSSEVSRMETLLDAEYVPFSFHDLRTNELLGFHAFLTSLTDDYTAAYEKTDGYGRVDPVRVYKSTERRINLSFMIAATSKNDFDEMWLKINKLVTLVYPQYTQGLQLSDATGQYVFTQPFSQLIGASPLIRIRLGDLLKSNYSQFNLARLFGAGNPNFQVDGQSFVNQSTYDQSILNSYDMGLANALAHPNGETYYVADGWYNLAPPQAGGLGLSVPAPPIPGVSSGGGAPTNAAQFNPGIASAGGVAGGSLLTIKATGVDDSGNILGQVQFNTEPGDQDVLVPLISSAMNRLNDPNDPLGPTIGGTYVIPPTALTPTLTTQTQIQNQVYQDSVAPFVTALDAFTNPTAQNPNAVAKAFADTGGKGLAGFIESMNFDWYDNVTWETDLNRTAPKMCRVTIGFAPVHDISPGIDHLGFNRAPVYPVGFMSQTPIPPASS